MKGFEVVYRNYGHWDVYQNGSRIYKIRGGPGKYWVSDEISNNSDRRKDFKTLQMAIGYITDTLMYELIIASNQDPIIIESWNV